VSCSLNSECTESQALLPLTWMALPANTPSLLSLAGVLQSLVRYLARLDRYSSTCTSAGLSQALGPVLMRPESLPSTLPPAVLTKRVIWLTETLIK
jgi:hypothetical protein